MGDLGHLPARIFQASNGFSLLCFCRRVIILSLLLTLRFGTPAAGAFTKLGWVQAAQIFEGYPKIAIGHSTLRRRR
jgi:hypothetical protein